MALLGAVPNYGRRHDRFLFGVNVGSNIVSLMTGNSQSSVTICYWPSLRMNSRYLVKVSVVY